MLRFHGCKHGENDLFVLAAQPDAAIAICGYQAMQGLERKRKCRLLSAEKLFFPHNNPFVDIWGWLRNRAV